MCPPSALPLRELPPEARYAVDDTATQVRLAAQLRATSSRTLWLSHLVRGVQVARRSAASTVKSCVDKARRDPVLPKTSVQRALRKAEHRRLRGHQHCRCKKWSAPVAAFKHGLLGSQAAVMDGDGPPRTHVIGRRQSAQVMKSDGCMREFGLPSFTAKLTAIGRRNASLASSMQLSSPSYPKVQQKLSRAAT